MESEQVEHPGQHDTEAILMIASDQNSMLNSMMSQTPCTQHMQYITHAVHNNMNILGAVSLAARQMPDCQVQSGLPRAAHKTLHLCGSKGRRGDGVICAALIALKIPKPQKR